MKKINSSSLLISISFILVLSLITSIFLISFKDNFNIENNKLNYIKELTNEENQIKYYENSMNRNFYNKFKLGNYNFTSSLGLTDPRGTYVNYSVIDLNGFVNESNIIKVLKKEHIEYKTNTYYQISILTNLSNKFNINIKRKTICNNVDNLSLKELLNNEDCFTKDGKTNGSWWVFQDDSKTSSMGVSMFKTTTVLKTKFHNSFKKNCDFEMLNLEYKNNYSKSFIGTFCKFMEELDYENTNIQSCFYNNAFFPKMFFNINCLRDVLNN